MSRRGKRRGILGAVSSRRKYAWIGALVVVCGAGCGIDAVATAGAGPTSPDASSLDGEAHLPEAGPGLDAVDAPVDVGCVADLKTDTLNCGRCGHSCLDGDCAAGKCGPVVLVSGEPGLGAVALDATTIYFAVQDSGGIRSLPIAGGLPTDVLSTGRAPHDLVLDGDRLFWGDQFGAGMHIFSPPSTITIGSVGSVGRVTALAKTPTHVYMITQGMPDTTVDYWKRDFTSPIGLVNNGASPAVVVDGANAYWSAGKEIRRVPYGTTTVANVVVGLATAPTSMAITPTHLYWATPSQVQRGTIASGTGWTVATLVTGETNAGSLTVDASGMYWLDLPTGALRHAALSGGPPETLATFSPQATVGMFPRQIALSATAIYVASTTDGTLSRIAK